jgi:hypothetical protein
MIKGTWQLLPNESIYICKHDKLNTVCVTYLRALVLVGVKEAHNQVHIHNIHTLTEQQQKICHHMI